MKHTQTIEACVHGATTPEAIAPRPAAQAAPADGGLTRVTDGQQRFQLAIHFRVDSDVRFISHHDTMRLFQRALARADLPLAYSEGFNPHPRLSLPLPRPVGMASEAELLLARMTEPVEADDALSRLGPQMPAGMELTQIQSVAPGRSYEPVAARYRLESVDDGPADLPARLERVQQADVVPITRVDRKTSRVRTLNLREYLMDIMLTEDHALDFWLKVTQQGSIRPSEVAATLGYDGDSINHRIRRLEVRWSPGRIHQTQNTTP